jgi:hypothetical protein
MITTLRHHRAARQKTTMFVALLTAMPAIAGMPASVSASPSGMAAAAQEREITMAEALSGTPFPLTRKLSDLSEEWRRFSLERVGEDAISGTVMRMLTASEFGSMGNLYARPVYYTRGETVRIEGKRYLIAYVWKPKLPTREEIEKMPDRELAPEVITPDTPVRLALVSVASIRGMSNIRPFDLKVETNGDSADGVNPFRRARIAAQNTSSLSNLKQIGLGVMMYVQDYDEKFPPMKSGSAAKKAIMPYIKNEDVFVHPASKKPYLPNPLVSGMSLSKMEAPADLIIFYEPEAASDGTRGAVFADGHAKRLNEQEWLKAATYSRLPTPMTPK